MKVALISIATVLGLVFSVHFGMVGMAFGSGKKNLPKSFKRAGNVKQKFNRASHKGIAKNRFNRASRKSPKNRFNKLAKKGYAKSRFNRAVRKRNIKNRFNRKSKRGIINSKPYQRSRKRLKSKFGARAGKGYPKASFNKSATQRKPSSLYQNALQRNNPKEKLSRAARAVSKHPQYFGFKNNDAFAKKFRSEVSKNNFAAGQLRNILRNGRRTWGTSGGFPNGYITYTLKNGVGASWKSNGEFIGFRGPKNMNK